MDKPESVTITDQRRMFEDEIAFLVGWDQQPRENCQYWIFDGVGTAPLCAHFDCGKPENDEVHWFQEHPRLHHFKPPA